uniref:Protein SEY1 n=1 Tax=Zeugodacus cucurbitae TaxID=28588 RepID=A0A0A1XHZ2_ZEUCU
MTPNTTSAPDVNPNENLHIPNWVNQDYFLPIIKNDVEDFRKIISFKSYAATAPGENYCSVMLRVIIELELKDSNSMQISYILKTMLDNSNSGSVIANNMNMFPKEKHMYSIILPKFMKLFKEANVDVRFGPTCKYSEETPERITLVLEDLKRANYVNCDRLKGLDMEHMTRVLQKLAEMHAASACNFEAEGSYGELYKNTFFTEANRRIYLHLQRARDPVLRNAMREWPLDDIEDYIAILPEGEQIFNAGLRLNDADPNEFNVLNHGDLWTNNIMFRYELDEIQDVLFIDFQLGKWGTPAMDLWYLIITSAAIDIKVREFDQFIYIYQKQLAKSLKILNYAKPIPSLKYLQMQLLKYGSWGFNTAKSVLCGILLPTDKDASFENFMKPGPEGDALRHKSVSNKYYSSAMCVILPFLRHKGLLDFQNASAMNL